MLAKRHKPPTARREDPTALRLLTCGTHSDAVRYKRATPSSCARARVHGEERKQTINLKSSSSLLLKWKMFVTARHETNTKVKEYSTMTPSGNIRTTDK